MRQLAALVLVCTAACAGFGWPAGPATAATAPTTLRLDGVGPLKLGMSRTAAVRTGWLSDRTTGCPLGGPPLPIVYRLRGAAAPKGVTGFATFTGGELTGLSFDRGVRTALGVTVGTTTVARMASRYRGAGYTVKTQFSSTFQGTFVDVTKGTRRILGGFATGRVLTTLALPGISVCD